MGLETGTYISDLNASNPVGASDPKSQGDDHLRLVKSTILATFPNVTGAMSLTHTQVNNAAIKDEENSFTATQEITAALAGLRIIETGATVNEGGWEFRADGDALSLFTLNDAKSASATPLTILRSGTTANILRLVATNIQIRNGSVFQIFEAGNSDNMSITHDGTDINCAFSGTAALNLFDGVDFTIWDATDTKNILIDHDGTDANFRFTGTADLNFDIASSLTGQIKIFAPVHIVSGNELQIRDAGNADTVTFAHDGTNFSATCVQTAHYDFVNVGTGVRVRDGAFFQVFNSADAKYIRFQHDGTDVNITNSGTTEVNLDTPVQSPNLDAGEWGHKGAPQRILNTSGSLSLTDCGKQIYKTSGGAGETITIPANSSVAFPIGTIIEIVNDGGGDLSLAITTDTLEELATGNTGTRTLPDNNKAVIEKVSATLWKYAATA